MKDSWVAIDFETANAYRGSPCSVGMVAVEHGHITDRMGTLIRPPAARDHFDAFNTRIHGISSTAVQNAPVWRDALAQIVTFAAGRPLVAHNAAFDTGVLRDACTVEGITWPTLSYACSLVTARKTWRLVSYVLPEVSAVIGAPMTGHHEAGADAEAAARVMLAALEHHGAQSLEELLSKLGVGFGTVAPGAWAGCRSKSGPSAYRSIPGANPEADPGGALYGQRICITGTLASMKRAEAQAAAAHVGASPVSKVNKKTNVLVIATPDPRRFMEGADKSAKQREAEALLDAGHEIEIIGEADFLERLNS